MLQLAIVEQEADKTKEDHQGRERDPPQKNTRVSDSGGEDGVFGCVGMMACADVCPKELPLLEVNAYLRRKVFGARFAGQSGSQPKPASRE